MTYIELVEAILNKIHAARQDDEKAPVVIYVGNEEWSVLMDECRYGANPNSDILFGEEYTFFDGHKIFCVNRSTYLAVHTEQENILSDNKFEPDYEKQCDNCGQVPTVRIVNAQGQEVMHTEMCGPCTWGEAETIDLEKW